MLQPVSAPSPPPIDLKRTLNRARNLYEKARRLPLTSNARAKAIEQARGLVGVAHAVAEQQGIRIADIDAAAMLIVALDNLPTGRTVTTKPGGPHGQDRPKARRGNRRSGHPGRRAGTA